MDIESYEEQYETEQELIKLINLEEQYGVFEFTFKTDDELWKEEFACNDVFSYNCIRVERTFDDGAVLDVPIKTEEEYHNFLNGDNLNFHVNDPRVVEGSIKLYQVTHGYENKSYYSYC